ncbi:MAG: hypothetical protein AAGC99_21075 [Pseudomonadota bacterium]
MNAATENLASLVERAYQVFDDERPSSLLVCTACCMDASHADHMLTLQPCDLDLRDVESWLSAAWSADAVESRHVVRWIMPRILELLIHGELLSYCGHFKLSRLRDTGFPQAYNLEEANLLRDFAMKFVATFVDCPESLNRECDLDDSLIMFAAANIDMVPILDRLDACPDSSLVERIVECVGRDDHSVYLDPKVYITRRQLCGSRSSFETIHRWYTSDEMLQRMLTYAEGSSGTLSQRQIAWETAEAILAISSADVCNDSRFACVGRPWR